MRIRLMRIAAAAVATLAIAGCGQIERAGAGLTGHSEHCVDGVKYIQFVSGATVKYRPDGSVATCGRAAKG